MANKQPMTNPKDKQEVIVNPYPLQNAKAPLPTLKHAVRHCFLRFYLLGKLSISIRAHKECDDEDLLFLHAIAFCTDNLKPLDKNIQKS